MDYFVSEIPVLISTAVLLIFLYWLLHYFKNKKYYFPPGPSGIPFIGFSPNLGHKPYEMLNEFARQYGDIFTLRIMGNPFIVLNSYEAIKAAYITDGNNFLNRPEEFNVLGSILNFRGFAFKNGEEWKMQRKIMSSSMKFLTLTKDDAGRTVLENRILETTRQMIEEIRNWKCQPVNLYEIFAHATINVVSSLVCGEPLERNTAQIIMNDVRRGFSLLPNGDGFIHGRIVRLISNKFTQQQKEIAKIRERQFNLMRGFIQEHKSTFDPNNVRDYIDMVLAESQKFGADTQEGQWLTEENLCGNMLMFFMAGTDTTASSMYFGAFLMAKYPEVQSKCQEELDRVVGHGETITLNDRKRLPYVEAVLNEIIRYSVIGPVPQPRATQGEAILLHNYRLPPKTQFLINLWSATRDEKHWSNPHEFDPNNFFGKNMSRDLASLAFSIGKRMCPGENLARQEMFLFFTALLQKFTLSGSEELHENVVPGFTRVLVPFKVIANPR